jgi:protease I
MTALSGKIVLMIIASINFRDPEFLVPKTVLEASGVKVVTASTALTAKGAEGTVVKVDVLLDKVYAANYDAVLFIGGPGAGEYFDNPTAHKIAKDAVAKGKVLGSICIAGTTLAKAGVLKGRKATVFPTGEPELVKGGAIYTGKDVEIDGKIITANGPKAGKAFGEAIVKALSK